MAVTAIIRDQDVVCIVRMTDNATLATVAGANYILNQAATIEALNNGVWEWQFGDIVLVAASDGSEFFRFNGSDFSTLVQLPGGNGSVTLPVVSGNFAVFNGTLGALQDSGYMPSNAAKTNVVMANGASIVNHVATYTDTAGTIGEDAATAINGGNIQAGLSGTAGHLASFPSTASSGSLLLTAVANSGNFNVTISNASHGQSTVYSIADVGAATGQLLNKTAALVNGNLIQASGTAGIVVDSGISAAAQTQFAQVTLSAAQFNGMYAAPVLLVAAPGANKMIIVQSMQLDMTFVSADYAAGGVVAAQYGATVHGAGPLATNSEAAADFFAAASTVFSFSSVSGNTVGALPLSTCGNAGIYLSNATQAFTTGDSTWIVKVYYHVISTNS